MTTTDAVPWCPKHPKYTGARLYHRSGFGVYPGPAFVPHAPCSGCDAVYAARHSGGWRETRRRRELETLPSETFGAQDPT